MSDENTAPEQRYVYVGYQGKEHPTERDRILHLLDTYSTTEGFVAQYIPKWIEVSPSETVQGGLRTVQGREALHARGDLVSEGALRVSLCRLRKELDQHMTSRGLPLYSILADRAQKAAIAFTPQQLMHARATSL